jgi:hypothetical protein
MVFNYVQLIFSSLISSLPLLLVWLIGAGLTIAWWKRHPRVSKFALAGFLILIFQILLNTGWLTLSTYLHADRGTTWQFVYAADIAINLAFIALRLAGFVLVVLAVFQGRGSIQTSASLSSEEVAS